MSFLTGDNYPSHFGNGVVSAVDMQVALYERARLGDRYPVTAFAVGAPLVEAVAAQDAATSEETQPVVPQPRDEAPVGPEQQLATV